MTDQATKELIASQQALIEHIHAQNLCLVDDRHRLLGIIESLQIELYAEKKKRRGTAEIFLPPKGTL